MVISLRAGNWSVIFETPLYLDDLQYISLFYKSSKNSVIIFPSAALEYQGKLDALYLGLGWGKASLAYLRPHQVMGYYAWWWELQWSFI